MSRVVELIVAKIWPLRDVRKPTNTVSLGWSSSSFSSVEASSSPSLTGLALGGAAKTFGAPNGQYIVCKSTVEKDGSKCGKLNIRRDPLHYRGRPCLAFSAAVGFCHRLTDRT